MLLFSWTLQNNLNYATSSNIWEVTKFYNPGDKSFEADFSLQAWEWAVTEQFWRTECWVMACQTCCGFLGHLVCKYGERNVLKQSVFNKRVITWPFWQALKFIFCLISSFHNWSFENDKSLGRKVLFFQFPCDNRNFNNFQSFCLYSCYYSPELYRIIWTMLLLRIFEKLRSLIIQVTKVLKQTLVYKHENELSLSNFGALSAELWHVKHVAVFWDTWYVNTVKEMSWNKVFSTKEWSRDLSDKLWSFFCQSVSV